MSLNKESEKNIQTFLQCRCKFFVFKPIEGVGRDFENEFGFHNYLFVLLGF